MTPDNVGSMELPSRPLQTMGPPSRPVQNMEPPSRPAQKEDDSELIAHMHFHDPNMSELEMGLGIFANITGMSHAEWTILHQTLMLVDHPMIQKLPKTLKTLKRHIKKELPLLPMRKKSIPLVAEKIATEKALRKSIQTEGDTPMEDLYFFDPTHLYKAFMSSDIATNMHFGMAEYRDFPTELYHSRCWASSVRTTSGCYAHYPDRSPIFPSDFVEYKCLVHDCMVCCLGEQWHLGRVYSVGRDYCETASERGGVVVEVREVFNQDDLRARGCLPADLSPKMDSLELIIVAEHIIFLPEVYIQSGPIDVKLDYTSGEETDKLEHYGPLQETSEVGKQFVRRIVDSLDSMQFTPLCHTDPIRAELELQEFGRAHFVENWDVQRNGGRNCISVPLITFIDGFGLYRNSYRSLMGFYQTPGALSFSDRNRRANVLPITLGPHGSNFEDVVDALKQFKLLDKGMDVDINGKTTHMCVFTLCYTGDMPQQQENSGFKTQRAIRGCRFCFIDETVRGDLDYNTIEEGRYHYQTMRMRQGIKELRTKKDKNTRATKWGLAVDEPPLLQLSPALDVILTRPGDTAHSEYNGISRMMHELLIQGILNKRGTKAYGRRLRQFPFPKGWGRLQSPVHHLKSYSLSDHARWAAIIPGLLRTWLTEGRMQPHFFNAAKKHTDDPVTFVVRAFAAVAKSNSLLVTAFANDRERLGEIVKNARIQFQQLCTDAAGGVQTNPRRGVTPAPSRPATPMLPIASPTTGTAEKKGAVQYQNDRKKPNVHAGLHHEQMMEEYGPLGNVGVMIGEDFHR